MRPLALVLFATVACAGANGEGAPALHTTSADVQVTANRAESLARRRTFSIGPPEATPAGYRPPARPGEIEGRLRRLIAAELTRKGYVPVAESGDVRITFGAGQRPVSIHEASDISAEWSADDENADFTEDILVIDASDGVDGSALWHGATRTDVDTARLADDGLERSVSNLLSAFPSR